MPRVLIPFDGWRPSSGSHIGDGWGTATNVYRAFGAWRPWRSFVSSATVNDGPMVGRHAHLWSSTLGGAIGPPFYSPDNVTLFVGSPTRLYACNSGGFTDLSRAALYGPYGAGWRFASIGNDIWASNWTDPLQRRTNNAGLFANGVTSTFTPQPRFIVPFREHLLGANLTNAGRRQDELVWSDADNAVNFDPATGTSTSLAGSKALISIPGQITGLVGGQYGLAFKQMGLFYLEYTSTSQVIRPEVLSPTIGTAYPSSIIKTRTGVYFLGPDGFYQIIGLSEPVRISTPGIEQVVLDSGFSTYPFSALDAFYPWAEDLLAVGFTIPGTALIGWGMSTVASTWQPPTNAPYGSTFALLYDTVEQVWQHVLMGTNNATVFLERPHALTLYDQFVPVTWNGTASAYAPRSSSTANAAATTIATLYRSFHFEDATEFGQTSLLRILPLFSKTSPTATTISPTVTVTPLFDPFDSPGTPEVRTAANRNMSGEYPFQLASRFFKIEITLAAGQDFANFLGAWAEETLL